MDKQWQVNDGALCIKQGFWCDRETGEYVSIGPQAGQMLTVARVAHSWHPDNRGAILLGFVEHGRDLLADDRFVKIEPGQFYEVERERQFDLDREQSIEVIDGQR